MYFNRYVFERVLYWDYVRVKTQLAMLAEGRGEFQEGSRQVDIPLERVTEDAGKRT
jgi:hypothetical protein